LSDAWFVPFFRGVFFLLGWMCVLTGSRLLFFYGPSTSLAYLILFSRMSRAVVILLAVVHPLYSFAPREERVFSLLCRPYDRFLGPRLIPSGQLLHLAGVPVRRLRGGVFPFSFSCALSISSSPKQVQGVRPLEGSVRPESSGRRPFLFLPFHQPSPRVFSSVKDGFPPPRSFTI